MTKTSKSDQDFQNFRKQEIKNELNHLDDVEASLKSDPSHELPPIEDRLEQHHEIAPEVKKPESPKFTKIAVAPSFEKDELSPYPFHDLQPGEGFFVADDDVKGNTLNAMRSHAFHANNHYSTPVHDMEGNEVWENLIIHGHKRNPKAQYDQFGNLINEFELDSSGKPFVTTEERSVPKVVHHRHFSVKKVVKDDVISGNSKAESDGVVVMREV